MINARQASHCIFSSTHLINSIKYEHSCKILYFSHTRSGFPPFSYCRMTTKTFLTSLNCNNNVKQVIDTVLRHNIFCQYTDTNVSFKSQYKKKRHLKCYLASVLGAKLCLHPFLHLENSLVNLFFRLEQMQKIKKKYAELSEFI